MNCTANYSIVQLKPLVPFSKSVMIHGDLGGSVGSASDFGLDYALKVLESHDLGVLG